MPTYDYERVIEDIRARIASGDLIPKVALPTAQQLAESYTEHWGRSVSVGTVRRAIDLLKDRGELEGQQGRGVFVKERPPAD